MAAGKLNRFAGLVDGSVTVPELKDNMDNKDLAIRELNQAAYCCLLYSMDEHISFNLVDTAKSARRRRCFGMEEPIDQI